LIRLGRTVANGHHEPSALDARARIFAFVDRHLTA